MQLVSSENGHKDTAEAVRVNGHVPRNGHAMEDGRPMEDEIRQFLAEIFFLGDDPSTLGGSESLIEAGIIDSTGVLELVGYLEEQYEIRIDDDELLPENLDTIDNIVGFVNRKRAAA